MQTRTLKILSVFSFLCLGFTSSAQVQLAHADSLFKAKQYMQSFELYENILQSNRYSPAMLLKMAYIQEGLGHVSKSIHYLQLYYQVTQDEQALKKIEQLADKFKLEGYNNTDRTFFSNTLRKYYFPISGVLSAIVIFMLTLIIYQKRKKIRPIWAGAAMVLVLGLLFAQTNFAKQEQHGIVAGRATYLMNGPSAGAEVVAVIGEGHQLKITGQKDVWMRVQWNNKEAFVKENKLLFAEI